MFLRLQLLSSRVEAKWRGCGLSYQGVMVGLSMITRLEQGKVFEKLVLCPGVVFCFVKFTERINRVLFCHWSDEDFVLTGEFVVNFFGDKVCLFDNLLAKGFCWCDDFIG